MTVVSLRGDTLSPKYAPEIIADYTLEDVGIARFYGIYENCFTGILYYKRYNGCGERYYAETVFNGVTFLTYGESEIDIVRL